MPAFDVYAREIENTPNAGSLTSAASDANNANDVTNGLSDDLHLAGHLAADVLST